MLPRAIVDPIRTPIPARMQLCGLMSLNVGRTFIFIDRGRVTEEALFRGFKFPFCPEMSFLYKADTPLFKGLKREGQICFTFGRPTPLSLKRRKGSSNWRMTNDSYGWGYSFPE